MINLKYIDRIDDNIIRGPFRGPMAFPTEVILGILRE